MKLTTVELVHINDAAKALKARNVALFGNAIVSMDNINYMLSYTSLDSKFVCNYYDWICINQRELSSFIANITAESEFTFDDKNNYTAGTLSGKASLTVRPLSKPEIDNISYKMNVFANMHTTMIYAVPNQECPELKEVIYPLSRDDGDIRYIYNGYCLTLFSPLIPLNKADKLLISIYEDPNEPISFIAQFTVVKKKFAVTVVIKYLKV